MGATAPIPPNGVPSEDSVARQGSLLRWGLLPPYPRLECPPNTQSLDKARSFVGGFRPHTPAKKALPILVCSSSLAPALGATAPIPPNGVPSEYSVARQVSLLRWGLLPPYPRMECPPKTQSLAKARSFVGGFRPHAPAKRALPILVCSQSLAPALGATAPIPPNRVPSKYSVARQGSLLRWGLPPPYPCFC